MYPGEILSPREIHREHAVDLFNEKAVNSLRDVLALINYAVVDNVRELREAVCVFFRFRELSFLVSTVCGSVSKLSEAFCSDQ